MFVKANSAKQHFTGSEEKAQWICFRKGKVAVTVHKL